MLPRHRLRDPPSALAKLRRWLEAWRPPLPYFDPSCRHKPPCHMLTFGYVAQAQVAGVVLCVLLLLLWVHH